MRLGWSITTPANGHWTGQVPSAFVTETIYFPCVGSRESAFKQMEYSLSFVEKDFFLLLFLSFIFFLKKYNNTIAKYPTRPRCTVKYTVLNVVLVICTGLCNLHRDCPRAMSACQLSLSTPSHSQELHPCSVSPALGSAFCPHSFPHVGFSTSTEPHSL